MAIKQVVYKYHVAKCLAQEITSTLDLYHWDNDKLRLVSGNVDKSTVGIRALCHVLISKVQQRLEDGESPEITKLTADPYWKIHLAAETELKLDGYNGAE